MPPDPTPETKSTALHSLNPLSPLCKAQSCYQTLYSMSLAVILLFQWNPFLSHTYLPNAQGSIPPSHLTGLYQWFTIIQKIKSRSLRMALRAPKPVLLASILNCSPGNLGLSLALPLLAMEPWASQLPLNVSFHISKMGITKLSSKANILPTPPVFRLCPL